MKFIKIGRVYYVLPKKMAIFKQAKFRPAIALKKIDKNNTIFLQLTTHPTKLIASLEASKLIDKYFKNSNFKSYVYLDMSKIEKNSCARSLYKIKNEVIDIDLKTISNLERLYFKRLKLVEKSLLNKAFQFAIKYKNKLASQQLQILKEICSEKYKTLKINDFIKNAQLEQKAIIQKTLNQSLKVEDI